jgi:hypothetical protein
MSPTSTSTTTYTRTNTAVYLTDIVMGTIADILADLRIDLSRLYRDWKQDEVAIAAWIEEGSLDQVVLECHQPNGAVAPVIEFPIVYRAGGLGDAAFTADRAALARYRAKLDRVPVGTSFAVICTFNGPHSNQAGWGPASRASTDGLQSLRFGALGNAPHASVGMRYWRK